MNHLYLLLISGILILQSCGGLHRTSQKPVPTTTPPQLELTVDQNSDLYTIPVSFTLNIPKNYIPSCARLIVIPHFSAQGYDQKLTPVIIQGKKHHTIEQRLFELEGISPDYPEAKRYVSDGNEMQIKINEDVPFQTWMPTSNLVLHSTLEAATNPSLFLNKSSRPESPTYRSRRVPWRSNTSKKQSPAKKKASRISTTP